MSVRVGVFAREAGGANALAPVVRRLQGAGRLALAGAEAGLRTFEAQGLSCRSLPAEASSGEVERFLRETRPKALLTGTSVEPDRDDVLWRTAREQGIGSVGYVDHWCNPAERFSHRKLFDCTPDVAAVLDDVAAARLRAAGYPGPVEVVGHPQLDELMHGRPADRGEERAALGVEPDRSLIVFVSQPQRTHLGTCLRTRPLTGYSEQTVAAAVVAGRDRVCPDALVLLKLHPLEPPDKFSELVTASRDVRVLDVWEPRRLIAAADVVVGLSSMMLVESSVLGVPTIGVEPPGEAAAPGRIVDIHELDERLAQALSGTLPAQAPSLPSDSLDRILTMLERVAAAAVTA